MANLSSEEKTEEKTGETVSISSGDIQGSQIIAATGNVNVENTQISTQTGVTSDELVKAFAEIYKTIDSRPPDPDVERKEIKDLVKNIEKEAQKGDDASATKVKRWLGYLLQMAPDVLDVVAASLVNPATGAAAIIQKVARKAQEEMQKM